MTCRSCLHAFEGPAGPECRRNPPQVVACDWTGENCGGKSRAEATDAERFDRRNYDVLAAFPPADTQCGDYVHRV